jgi:hypothetical protein
MRFSHLLLSLVLLTAFSVAQETNFSSGPQYLSLTGSSFLRPIATPTYSLDAPLPPIPNLPEVGPSVIGQPYISNAELANQANLFPIYYGYPMIPVVEITGTAPSEVPPSLQGDGVTRIVEPAALREMGYGVSMGEDAAFWKAHKRVMHVYTNTDIERLQR